jgi:hypothetical protein
MLPFLYTAGQAPIACAASCDDGATPHSLVLLQRTAAKEASEQAENKRNTSRRK